MTEFVDNEEKKQTITCSLHFHTNHVQSKPEFKIELNPINYNYPLLRTKSAKIDIKGLNLSLEPLLHFHCHPLLLT